MQEIAFLWPILRIDISAIQEHNQKDSTTPIEVFFCASQFDPGQWGKVNGGKKCLSWKVCEFEVKYVVMCTAGWVGM